MRFYVYVLQDRDSVLYVGYTSDLKRRIGQHASGKVRSTRARRYLKLVFYEYFIDKKDAKAREVFLKSGAGRKQIRKILQNTLTEENGNS